MEFTRGDPHQDPPIPATEIDEAWLNGIQRELLSILKEAGIKPEPDQFDQVSRSIQAIIEREIFAPKSDVLKKHLILLLALNYGVFGAWSVPKETLRLAEEQLAAGVKPF